MRKFFFGLLALLIIPLAYVELTSYAHADMSDLPPLESGDLIFETAITHQTPAIIFATGSIYTHVGVIHKRPDGSYTVIQARRHVDETTLEDFIEGGWGQRIKILRYPGLTMDQQRAIVRGAEQYLGRAYNYEFYMPSKDMYCSEIPYLAYKSLDLPIGKLEKISDLFVNNPAVHALFKERWQNHPACQAQDMDYASCWKTVLGEPIITPASLAHDTHLIPVYNNYLF